MATIPLPETLQGTRLSPKGSAFTNNLIPSQGELLSRPSCTKFESIAVGQPRGLFVFKNQFYSVFGQTMYKGAVSPVPIARINGSGKISVAIDYEKAAIATGQGNYILGEELVEVIDRDLPACRSVCVVDGTFVWTPVDGSPVCWSEMNNPSQVKATSFFDTEQLPDKNEISFNIRNDLYIAGAESIERFRKVGDTKQPFIRVNGSITSVGYVGGLIETKDSFLFIGKDKDGGFAIYVFDSASAIQVSNETVNELLNTEYSYSDMRKAQGQRFNWHGKDCYVFSIKGRDFIMVMGAAGVQWGFLSSGTDKGYFAFDAWGYRNAKFYNGNWYCQRSDGLFQFTYDDSDTSGEYIRSFRTSIRARLNQNMIFSALHLGVNQTNNHGSVGLSMSRDGRIWNEPFFVQTGGQFDNKVSFAPAGGLGCYEDGYCGIQISTTSNVSFAVDSMEIMQ